MKKLYRILILFLLFSSAYLQAQQLSPFVVSTSGGFYSNDSGMLSFTTGEMAAIETYITPAAILTQGFQQPFDLGTYVVEHPFEHFLYSVYPNPSNGYFDVMTESELDLQFTLALTDLLGHELLREHFRQDHTVNIHTVDRLDIAPGTYLLSLRIKDNSTGFENINIQKITIVQ